MILSAHQPGYLPYIGFFNKVMQSDLFVFSDHHQYEKKEWQNRNKIRVVKGSWMWLTVPVHIKTTMKIHEIKIDYATEWQKKHWKSLILNYSHSPFFKEHQPFFNEVYSLKWERLADLNEAIMTYIFKELQIAVPTMKGSRLNLEGKKTDRLIDMCQKVKADAYLSGIGGHEYLEEHKFRDHGIKLLYQEFHHPVYPQSSKPFLPNMCILDLLFNVGSEKSHDIILHSGNKVPSPTIALAPVAHVRN